MVAVQNSGLARDLAEVNSERKVMLMGAIGVLGDEAVRPAQEAYGDYVNPLPGIETFFSSSNFRQAVRDLSPTGDHINYPEHNGPINEQPVGLTESGLRLAGLGGLLLDLSCRTGGSLRTGLGKTHRRKAALQEDTPHLNAQAKYLNLGATLISAYHPQSAKQIAKTPGVGFWDYSEVHRFVSVWTEAQLVTRSRQETVSRAPHAWEFTPKGALFYRELLDVLDSYLQDPVGQQERGLGLLTSYFRDPRLRRNLPELYRRDYMAVGSDEKGKIEELEQGVRSAVAQMQPEELISTGELATETGRRNLSRRDLHRLVWLLGVSSPITHAETIGKYTTWRVQPPKPTLFDLAEKCDMPPKNSLR